MMTPSLQWTHPLQSKKTEPPPFQPQIPPPPATDFLTKPATGSQLRLTKSIWLQESLQKPLLSLDDTPTSLLSNNQWELNRLANAGDLDAQDQVNLLVALQELKFQQQQQQPHDSFSDEEPEPLDPDTAFMIPPVMENVENIGNDPDWNPAINA